MEVAIISQDAKDILKNTKKIPNLSLILYP